MKLLIALTIVLSSFVAQAKTVVGNVVKYEFGEKVLTMDVPYGTYDRISIRVATNGYYLVMKDRVYNDGSEVNLRQELERMTVEEFQYMQYFAKAMKNADIVQETVHRICRAYAHPADYVNDLSVYNVTQEILVSAANHCSMPVRTLPADQDLHEMALEVKDYLRAAAEDLLAY